MVFKPGNHFEHVHECDMSDDRQTDHGTEKCVAMGGIAIFTPDDLIQC